MEDLLSACPLFTTAIRRWILEIPQLKRHDLVLTPISRGGPEQEGYKTCIISRLMNEFSKFLPHN